jgi:hypothetical protein
MPVRDQYPNFLPHLVLITDHLQTHPYSNNTAKKNNSTVLPFEDIGRQDQAQEMSLNYYGGGPNPPKKVIFKL